MKTRNNAFDLLCGLCIIRMVTLHAICQTQLRQTPWWKEIMLWTFFFITLIKQSGKCRSSRGWRAVSPLETAHFGSCFPSSRPMF